MCVCFTLLEDFSTLLNHNLATTTTTTTTSTTTPCFCYSPAGVNIQEFSDLLLSYQSAISTVFDLLQIIIILLQKFSFFSKEGHVRGKQGARGFGYIAAFIWPSFLSLPLQNLCDVPLTFLSLQDQVSKVRSHWTFMALCSWKSEKKLIIKKITRTILLIIVITVVIVLLFYFPKKLKKKCLFILPTERVLLLFLLTTVYIFNTYFLTEGFLLCKEAAVTLSKIKYMFLKN